MGFATVGSDATSVASGNVRTPDRSKVVRNLFPIGKCLRRRISERPYSAYTVQCPKSTCAAMPGYKCVGVRGEFSPIPHIARERIAAEIYRNQTGKVFIRTVDLVGP
jgi:hypothetical protein